MAALGELDDAAAAGIGVAIGVGDLFAMSRDVVEDQAFAQRQIAERDLPGAETPEDRVEQHRTRHGEIRPARLETGHAQPFLDVQRDELLSYAPQELRRHPAVAHHRVE